MRNLDSALSNNPPPRAGSEVASAKVPLFAYAPTRPPHTALSVLKCPTTHSISTSFFVGSGMSVPIAHVESVQVLYGISAAVVVVLGL